MPVALQVKLLRVLQERKVRPLGSNRDIEINVRIISATHRDLPKAMARGEFREDLFYRLNVVNLKIPPLSNVRKTSRCWPTICCVSLPIAIAVRAGVFQRCDEAADGRQVAGQRAPAGERDRAVRGLTSSPVIGDALVEQALEGENTALPTFVEARNRLS